MKGDVLTKETYDRLKILFGPLVWDSDVNKIGQVCVDCSGLISWGTGIQRNSQGYHDTAETVFPISTVNQAPIGAAVWPQTAVLTAFAWEQWREAALPIGSV